MGTLEAKPTNAVIPKKLKIFTGGSAISKEQIKTTKKVFENSPTSIIYGSTELGGIITWPLNENLIHLEQHIASCGMPRALSFYKIVDVETRNTVPHGTPGELLVKSDMVMNGYYNMDSSECFENGWFRTGDMLLYHPDGCFYFVDRIKEMIKYRSWQVQPVVVEEVINRHPAVVLSVVVGIPHPEDGDHTLALVVLKEGHLCEPQEILEFANVHLNDVQRLRAGVRFIKEVMFTASGKVKRYQMRQLAIEGKI